MKKIIDFILKNGFVVFLIIIMITVGGIYSANNIKMEAMPNINIPMVTAVTVYPGASPEDISEKITDPIQKAVSSIQGIKDVKSTSNENVGVIIAEFDYSQGMDKGEKAVTDDINKQCKKAHKKSRVSFGRMPVMNYTV